MKRNETKRRKTKVIFYLDLSAQRLRETFLSQSRARRSGMEEFPYALTVEGPWPSTSTKTLSSKLQIYFQSRKKSQGGDCKVKVSEESGVVKVLFKSEEILDQVLAKGDHCVTIESNVVKLTVFKPGETVKKKEEPKAAARTGGEATAGLQQPG
uniref:PAR14-like first RRM domain-containing protein n=1 Tax=Astyanax mexicanus TaxID=7994 RepID=A0A8B9KHM3_ASTMX